MGSNILGKILSGVGQGYLSHSKERAADKRDAKDWETTKQRKRETLDMNDEYSQRSENRQRQNRVADEDVAYNKKLSRQDELHNKQLEEIKTMYPDRWADPMFQQEVTAGIRGIMVPPLPKDPKIAKLMMSGKIQEGLAVAANSKNPEDLKFYNSMIDSITKKKRLNDLLNPQTGDGNYGFKPDANIIQSALNQGQSAAGNILSNQLSFPGTVMSGPQSQPINMGGQSPIGSPSKPLDEKSVKQIRQIRDDAAKELIAIRGKYKGMDGNFDPNLMRGTEDAYRYQDIEDRYKKAAQMISSYSDSVLGGQPQQTQGAQQRASSPAMTSFSSMDQQFRNLLK